MINEKIEKFVKLFLKDWETDDYSNETIEPHEYNTWCAPVSGKTVVEDTALQESPIYKDVLIIWDALQGKTFSEKLEYYIYNVHPLISEGPINNKKSLLDLAIFFRLPYLFYRLCWGKRNIQFTVPKTQRIPGAHQTEWGLTSGCYYDNSRVFYKYSGDRVTIFEESIKAVIRDNEKEYNRNHLDVSIDDIKRLKTLLQESEAEQKERA